MLRRNPEAIHFATHVVPSNGNGQGLIALSLGADGQVEALLPKEVARWKVSARVVTLSGCHSAGAPVLPGAGLMGLTRAWLAAGARTVVATRWATPDEDGAMFAAMYRTLRSEPRGGGPADPAGALRSAQMETIRAGGWRARPSYWAAYFAAGGTQ